MHDSDDLRRRVDDLTERVGALERRDTHDAPSRAGETDALWALTELQARLPDDPATTDGAVMVVGSLGLPTGEPVAWQEGIGTAGLIESEWADRADTLAALGHPVRLELLRQILSGVRTTAELADTGLLGTTGQLHHHLRQLRAVGWVQQSGRGSYDVPAGRVVPLLTTLLGARR